MEIIFLISITFSFLAGFIIAWVTYPRYKDSKFEGI